MSRRAIPLLIASIVIIAGCSQKGPAEVALKAAEDAFSSIRADAEQYAPEAVGSMDESIKQARGLFDGGDYAGALAAAKELPAKVAELKEAAMAAKEAMIKEWDSMSGSMPAMVEAISGKVTELAGAKKLPNGMTTQMVQDAQGQLDQVNQTWTKAVSAAQSGNIMEAVTGARQVKSMAEKLMAMLGMSAPAGA